mmetsp:Transcript_2681/g.10705  ORF Transcript_2681/g.10705 Transcript_2681/m.10705 type:complete len:216 (-) Transcript_2681:1959-2606(-)
MALLLDTDRRPDLALPAEPRRRGARAEGSSWSPCAEGSLALLPLLKEPLALPLALPLAEARGGAVLRLPPASAPPWEGGAAPTCACRGAERLTRACARDGRLTRLPHAGAPLLPPPLPAPPVAAPAAAARPPRGPGSARLPHRTLPVALPLPVALLLWLAWACATAPLAFPPSAPAPLATPVAPAPPLPAAPDPARPSPPQATSSSASAADTVLS